MGSFALSVSFKGRLTPKQKKIAKNIFETPSDETKFHVILGSRQGGKSWLLEFLATVWCLLAKDKIVAYVSAYHRQNKKRYLSLIRWLPKGLIKRSVMGDDMEINFFNGSSIQFFTANSYDAIAGSSFNYLICDEFALWREDSWNIIAPTIAARPKSKVVMASTPRGKNAFYKQYELGESSDPYYKSYKIKYTDNPYYDLKFVEGMRKSMPEAAFKQEFEAEFIFGHSIVFGDISKHQTIHKKIPYDPKRRYFFGNDYGGSGEDDSIIFIVDDLGRVCYFEEIPSGGDNTFPKQARAFARVIKEYHAVGYGEKNGMGDPINDYIEELGVEKIYDFDMSNERKQDLINLLTLAFNDGQIQLPDSEWGSKLDNQMATYKIKRLPSGKWRYEHDTGLHDDYVDALLLAWAARNSFMFAGNVIADVDVDERIEYEKQFENSKFEENYNREHANDFLDLYDD